MLLRLFQLATALHKSPLAPCVTAGGEASDWTPRSLVTACPASKEWSSVSLLLVHEGVRRTCALATPTVASLVPSSNSAALAFWLRAHLTGPTLAYAAAMRTRYYPWLAARAAESEREAVRLAVDELLPAAERALQRIDVAATALAALPPSKGGEGQGSGSSAPSAAAAAAADALAAALDEACAGSLSAYMDYGEVSIAPIAARRATSKRERTVQRRVFHALGRSALKAMLPAITAAVAERRSDSDSDAAKNVGASARYALRRLRRMTPPYAKVLSSFGLYAAHARLNEEALRATIVGVRPNALEDSVRGEIAARAAMYATRIAEELLLLPMLIVLMACTFVLCHCMCHGGKKDKRV